MNVKQPRITEELSWKSLTQNYYVGTVVVDGQTIAINKLQDAISDGTLLAMVTSCADKMHEGDVGAVVEAIKRNLSSNRTNFSKKDYNPAADVEASRLALLWSFFDGLAVKEKKVVAGLPASTKEKALWELTVEEITSLDTGNYKVLDSVYQNMMSKKSKKPEDILDMDEFKARLKLVSSLRTAAKAAAKAAANTIIVPEDIMSKVLAGKALTKAESADLAELLLKLRK
jgi:hypothetical protein